MKRIIMEWYIIRETVLYIMSIRKGYNQSLRASIKDVFKRRDSKYRINDGPWIKGSSYDRIRHSHKERAK